MRLLRKKGQCGMLARRGKPDTARWGSACKGASGLPVSPDWPGGTGRVEMHSSKKHNPKDVTEETRGLGWSLVNRGWSSSWKNRCRYEGLEISASDVRKVVWRPMFQIGKPSLKRFYPSLKYLSRASLAAQWLRICLPMQGTRVRALVWEDPTCRGATGSVSHNYGAYSPQQQRPRWWEARAPRWRVAPARRN